jgi:excisionase family DNA binding protein
MRWLKVDQAREYAGGVSRKTLYSAVAQDRLKAARVGAGRNLLFCEQWIDEWLRESAEEREPDKAVRS